MRLAISLATTLLASSGDLKTVTGNFSRDNNSLGASIIIGVLIVLWSVGVE